MTLASALRSGLRLPVQCFWTVLPFFLLSTGGAVVARVPLLAGFATVLALWRVQGRIEPVVRAFDQLEPGALDPTIPGSIPPDLVNAVSGLVTPTVVVVLSVSLLLTVVCGIVAQAFVSAGTFSAIDAALDGGDPLTVGVRGLARYWKPLLGLALLEFTLVVVGVLPLAVGLGVGIFLDGLVALIVGMLAGLVSVVSVFVVLLALSFARAAIVVDDVGVLQGVRNSLSFIRHQPITFLLYVVITVGLFVAFFVLAGLSNLVGIPRLIGVVVPVVFSPVLSGFQLALYSERDLPRSTRDAIVERETALSDESTPSRRQRFGQGLRRGWHALRCFVVDHPLANLASTVLLVVGIAAGWALTAPYGVAMQPPEDVSGVFGTFAVGPFVNIATNNWLVAVGGSYGGLALGVPAAAGLLFNGAVVGALGGMFDRTAFVALVAPHGIVELPALVVSGGLGLHLGRVGFDGLRGRIGAVEVGEALGRTFEILVGLAVVFVVAAFIEAFLTPQIAALVLNG